MYNKSIKMPQTDYNFLESVDRNQYSFDFYTCRLVELGMSMFEYTNLPEPIDWRFIEYTLMYNGFGVFFKEDVIDEYAYLQATLYGDYDFYRTPKRRRVYSVSGYNRELNEDNSVIVWNNVMRTPTIHGVLFYARKLCEIDRILDVNLNAQKTPVLVLCDEDERLTLKNIYKQYSGNEPFIFGSKNLDLMSKLQVFRTDAPFLMDKLNNYRVSVWNDALTYLGIQNVNFEKKERLISDEVSRAMGGTISSRQSRLESRREAVEQINKMFGLNIEVNFRDDFRQLDADGLMYKSDTEGGSDVEAIAYQDGGV